ncbi:ankyrin repeat and FYVE domain containing 1 [Nothobranchius furzeri]|uniref:Ankyrin repeat and FYVE domain containing 1 n=2 Tax=Nothobranchius furzeri TaxID=105023 RepID=A0A1A8VEZ0_NOTFU|nr:ankyrin repeat and FYVE domain containing 1 [Nothobranchius furzeri]
MAEEEVAKLQKHLALLRQEYVKMQQKLVETERRCAVLAAQTSTQGCSSSAAPESFISRLLDFVANLYQQEHYSDLKVKVAGVQYCAHKFVLAARSDVWSLANMVSTSELDLTDCKPEVAMAMLRWAYTDDLELSEDDAFLIDLMKLANRFQLQLLRERCEKGVMSSVNVRNCICFYQTAEELNATTLMNYCGEIIASHWDDLRKEDFSTMSAQLLYKMIKSKTEFPLHKAIKVEREDVVFLYLIEMDSQLPGKLNELDNNGDLALDLALCRKLEGIATTLVNNKADVDMVDQSGWSLLHKAIQRGDEFASIFLIRHSAQVNAATVGVVETPLHLVCSFSPKKHSVEVMSSMARIAEALLKAGANPNMQNSRGRTPLHEAVASGNEAVFNQLLQCKQIDLELKDHEGSTALWLALQHITMSSDASVNPFEDDTPVVNGTSFDENGLAAQLIKRGSNPDSPDHATGNCLMQRAALAGNEAAALFLATHRAKVNHVNKWGESPLHTACRCGLACLTAELLQQGANPNLQTQKAGPENSHGVALQTPLHMAIAHNHPDVVSVILEQKANALHATNNLQIIPDFSLKDSVDQTVLGLALWTGMHTIAAQLLGSGASINDTMSNGQTLLHMAIQRQDSKSALFLLEHQADINVRTQEGQTPLQLAISNQLPLVVDAICTRGADMSVMDDKGDPPLWLALESGLEDIASTLVRHGCDATCWSAGPSGCIQTLLHRAIDENNEVSACFLIRSGCEVNSTRRPGPNGEGDEEARDGQTPLHLASSWGLEEVVQCLLEFAANVNAQDAEGRAPIHAAISNQHNVIIQLLISHPDIRLNIRDRQGMTPFACAMTHKNNKAAEAILKREPGAAEQVDNKGRNFLHVAVQNSDIESVLFLISVQANVNSRVQDSAKLSPLHLAVQAGSEIIVRNLLLAGAKVNEVTKHRQTALHLAAQQDLATICSVLLENGIDFAAEDENGNNALHLAVMQGRLNNVRTLLTESNIDAEAFNLRGQSPMHILGQYGKENAAAIFELFLECMPEYPLDKPDNDGNSVLLLAYMKGNANLCRAIVRAGAPLGTTNNQGVNIFNYQVATKQLLFRLLDMLSKEPPWCDGSNCYECAAKFGVTTRKHHCRHCGRLLCHKCSIKEMPIIKFDLNKPVRVCEICYDVLTLGGVS